MTAFEILSALWSEGIRARLTADGENLSVTAGRLTPTQRTLLLSAKPQLIEFLTEAKATADAVREQAMKVSDRYGDSEEARQEMLKQIGEVPAHLQSDLLLALGGKSQASPASKNIEVEK